MVDVNSLKRECVLLSDEELLLRSKHGLVDEAMAVIQAELDRRSEEKSIQRQLSSNLSTDERNRLTARLDSLRQVEEQARASSGLPAKFEIPSPKFSPSPGLKNAIRWSLWTAWLLGLSLLTSGLLVTPIGVALGVTILALVVARMGLKRNFTEAVYGFAFIVLLVGLLAYGFPSIVDQSSNGRISNQGFVAAGRFWILLIALTLWGIFASISAIGSVRKRQTRSLWSQTMSGRADG